MMCGRGPAPDDIKLHSPEEKYTFIDNWPGSLYCALQIRDYSL